MMTLRFKWAMRFFLGVLSASVFPNAYAATPSVSGANIPSESQILDAKLNSWTLVSGVVHENSKPAGYTSDVILLLYKDGTVYEENKSDLWWSWNGSDWKSVKDPRVPSASGTSYTSTSSLVDTSKDVWAVSSGVVYKNGKTAGTTSGVSNLYYKSGVLYEENTSDLWWSWSGSDWEHTSNPTGSTTTTTSAPTPAAAVGYTKNAFNSDFTTVGLSAACADTMPFSSANPDSKIDLKDTQASGYGWYMNGPATSGGVPKDNCDLSIVSDPGGHALRISGAKSRNIYTMMKGSHGVVGNQWGGMTAGAYFEARVAFSSTTNYPAIGAWPGFWSLPGLDGGSMEWPGNSFPLKNVNNGLGDEPYRNSVEVDIMEYMPTAMLGGTPQIRSTMHNWHGYANGPDHTGGTCPTRGEWGSCDIDIVSRNYDKVASSPSAPSFMTIGALWVPAATNGGKGYVQYYLNEEPYGTRVEWTGTPPALKNPSQKISPQVKTITPKSGQMTVSEITSLPQSSISTIAQVGSVLEPSGWVGPNGGTEEISATFQPWTMGAMDLQPHALILQSGGGAFMDVQWVRVWQK